MRCQVLIQALDPYDINLACLTERKRATHMLILPSSLVFYRTYLTVTQYYN